MSLGSASTPSGDVGRFGRQPETGSNVNARPKPRDLDYDVYCAPDSLRLDNIAPLSPPRELSLSFNPWEVPDIPKVDNGKQVERGRTLERDTRYPNPLARAESRAQRSLPAIELDARHIRTRGRSSTLHDDPQDIRAILDDQMLEPFVGTPQRNSVSEVLSGLGSSSASLTGALDAHELEYFLRKEISRSYDTPSSSSRSSGRVSCIEPPNLANTALTTVFSYCRRVFPEPTVARESLSQRVDRLEDLADRSSVSLTSSSPSIDISTTFSTLPTEINQQIYFYLSPVDFNAARHTCRAWYANSLHRALLETMLKRGGWNTSWEKECSETGLSKSRRGIDYEWILSKRISRECALGPGWTGKGISILERFQEEPKSAFNLVSAVDFTEVAVHYSETTPGAGITFTVSSCGKFLMVANGCLVYIYELNKSHNDIEDWSTVQPGSLRPVTSVICPHRVIACSMDTSSNRYSIAVLLEGRMGIVCDISMNHIIPPKSQPGSSDFSRRTTRLQGSDLTLDPNNDFHHGITFLDRVSLDSSAPVASAGGHSTTAFVFPGIATTRSGSSVPEAENRQNYEEKHDAAAVGQTSYPPSIAGSHFVGMGSRSRSKLPACNDWSSNSRAMPIESGPRSLYRNLCSEDDPPRSVAICPQRRCVAFGCSSGIELHWVDALTGQDLNRWFPLTAPSDFLFFLPPRKSVDSAKKLRLISSAARPSDRAALHERSFGRRSRTGSFWERLGWNASQGDNSEDMTHTQDILLGRYRGELDNILGHHRRIDQSDHYRAVPLSDGYHILFTDPGSGALCMGSDAPVGGPTKLLRKVWFQCPEGSSPIVYAGGSDLSWGLRVVAAYGSGEEQSIWMFSVPADVFHANQTSQALLESSVWQQRGEIKSPTNMHWLEWWPDNGIQEWLNLVQNPIPGVLPGNMWPIKIQGQKIGTCRGVVDLAIDSSKGVTIWAYTMYGIAKVWSVDDGQRGAYGFGGERFMVSRDGTVREDEEDRDTVMSDVTVTDGDLTPLTPTTLRIMSPLDQGIWAQRSFDGTFSREDQERNTSSFHAVSASTSSRRIFRSNWTINGVKYDEDGDVIMEDVDDRDAREWYREYEETPYEASRSVQDQQFEYLNRRWSRGQEVWSGVGIGGGSGMESYDFDGMRGSGMESYGGTGLGMGMGPWTEFREELTELVGLVRDVRGVTRIEIEVR